MLSRTFHSIIRRVLPWRLNQRMDTWRLERLRNKYDDLIDRTPSIGSDLGQDPFEIHSLLGRRQVGMCLWSVKSLLHHAQRPYAVVLHDDGTLRDQDFQKLANHLVNVKIITRAEADRQVASKLEKFPSAYKYRFGELAATDWGRRVSVFALQLLDYGLLAETRKILCLDTDVLFFKRPNEIIGWAEDAANADCLYCYDEYRPVRGRGQALLGFKKKNEPQCYFNAGLICLNTSALDLTMMDDWLFQHRNEVDKVYTFAQQAYNHIVHRYGSHTPLPATYSFNYNDPDCVATHFGIKELFFDNLPRVYRALTVERDERAMPN